MTTISTIDASIAQAYLETDYNVHGEMPMKLKVGDFNQTLLSLHEQHKVRSSAFITACNPFSREVDNATNAMFQTELASELQAKGTAFIDGIGKHSSNNWPGEPSFLVFGLSLDDAKTLGAKHEQNAIIWCGPDAIPQLILLR